MLRLKINFFDDGAATEPDAVIAAILTLTQKTEDFVWLWSGGKDKGGSLENLASLIEQKTGQNKIFDLSLFGQVGDNLALHLAKKRHSQIKNIITKETYFRTLLISQIPSLTGIKNKFKLWLQELANKEDILSLERINLNVVLSPGGSSFGEFENYKERSKFWTESILNLK